MRAMGQVVVRAVLAGEERGHAGCLAQGATFVDYGHGDAEMTMIWSRLTIVTLPRHSTAEDVKDDGG